MASQESSKPTIAEMEDSWINCRIKLSEPKPCLNSKPPSPYYSPLLPSLREVSIQSLLQFWPPRLTFAARFPHTHNAICSYSFYLIFFLYPFTNCSLWYFIDLS